MSVASPETCAEVLAVLTDEDRGVLSVEMALTAIADQSFQAAPTLSGGPAFLVYYSPAFLRTAAAGDAVGAMRILSEVYRQARAMWPRVSADGGKTVTVRIDQLKDLSVRSIEHVYSEGHCWMLVKRNAVEAVVEEHALYAINPISDAGTPFRLLQIWNPAGAAPHDVAGAAARVGSSPHPARAGT